MCVLRWNENNVKLLILQTDILFHRWPIALPYFLCTGSKMKEKVEVEVVSKNFKNKTQSVITLNCLQIVWNYEN